MHRNLPLRIAYKTFTMLALRTLYVLVAVGATAQPWDQTDWKQWTDKDVQNVLYKSPWVAGCCREWDNGPYKQGGPADLGHSASIVSSLAVRQALVRRMVLEKRYQKLDLAARKEIDRRIAACLNQNFDDQIVLSFSISFSHHPGVYPMSAPSDRIHLLTSDGSQIVGRELNDSIAMKCGELSIDPSRTSDDRRGWTPTMYEPEHELAFPRYVNGKPTIEPDDKKIRIT